MTFTLRDRMGNVEFEGERVTRTLPCPICSDLHRNQSWCLVDTRRGLAICPRVESKRRIGDAGWLHTVAHGQRGAAVAGPPAEAWQRQPQEEKGHWRQLWASYSCDTPASAYADLAKHLGLPLEYAHHADLGLTEHRHWAFAMLSSAGDIIGIKIRKRDGKKLAVQGSRLGVIRSRGFSAAAPTLVVTEGESDMLVAAEWGLNAVARPGSMSCTETIKRMSVGKAVVLICDRDDAGKAGAAHLAEKIQTTARSCVTVWPPYKDLREWCQKGGSLEALRWRISSRSGRAEVPI